MPELPEVETTRRGIAPHIVGRTVVALKVRDGRLRWPVPRGLAKRLVGNTVDDVKRRGKYLLIMLGTVGPSRPSASKSRRGPTLGSTAPAHGHLIIHLGMSGSLRVVAADLTPRKHDHVDLVLDDGQALRFHDPRRFGCLLWHAGDVEQHPLLKSLGVEPLGDDFDAGYLHARLQGRRIDVKQAIMNSHIVVGVGNIYASEALFHAGIGPRTPAGRLSLDRCGRLVDAIKQVLAHSIARGGTTLRDFVGSDGEPGYFAEELFVYGRADEPCRRCGRAIEHLVQGQRSSYYCPRCQR